MSKENLLEQIKNAIVNNDDLTSILLKCKLLAYEIKSQELLTWVNNELMGYRESNNIPDYRCVRVSEIKATFINRLGVSINRDIPFGLNIPEPFASQLYCTYLSNSVAELIDYEIKCKNDPKYNLKLNLHGSFYAILEDCFESSDGTKYSVQNAWQLFAGQSVYGVLTSIKSKLLEFVCKFGEIYKCDLTSLENMETKTTQIINSTIYSLNCGTGTINNSSSNSAIGNNATISINDSDKEKLREIWNQIDRIKSNIDEDAQELAEYMVELKKEIDGKISCPTTIRKTLRAIKSIVNKAGEVAIENGLDQCFNMLSQYI